MSSFRSILLLVLTSFLVACAIGGRLYEGPALDQSKIAVMYTGGGAFSVKKIIQTKTKNRSPMAKRYELLPGTYTILLDYRVAAGVFHEGGAAYQKIQYRYYLGDFNLQSGMTYTFRPDNIYSPTEICALEEAHDAIGARLNVTGEIRTASPEAKVSGCAQIITVAQFDHIFDQP